MDWLLNEDKETQEECHNKLPPWKIVIVDDDEEIHIITKLSLNEFSFEGRAIEFISLYSGSEAKEYFKSHHDIAMVLLDVVMESDDSGLTVANYLREELKNKFTRIILRTGQPGIAPEQSVLRNFDIDGYIAKTEGTINTLRQTVYVGLRSYRDLSQLQSYQRGLEIIIASISSMSQIDDILVLSKGVMTQIASLCSTDCSQLSIASMNGLSQGINKSKAWNIMMEGNDARLLSSQELVNYDKEMQEFSNSILSQKSHVIKAPLYGFYYCSTRGTESVFILKTEQCLNKRTTKLLKLFVTNIVLAMEKLSLLNSK